MALPTWKEWLLAQTCKEGTWLNSVSKKSVVTVSGWAGENPNEARLRVGAAKVVVEDPVLAHRFRTMVTGEALALIAVLTTTALLMGAAS